MFVWSGRGGAVAVAVAVAGTGRTGFSRVAPNHYPFYAEHEKYMPMLQADGGQLSGKRARRSAVQRAVYAAQLHRSRARCGPPTHPLTSGALRMCQLPAQPCVRHAMQRPAQLLRM